MIKEEHLDSIEDFLSDIAKLLDFLNRTSFEFMTPTWLPKKASKGPDVKLMLIGNQFTESLEQTFDNLRFILSKGCYSDAFSLIRKFRDDLFLYLVFIHDSVRFRDKTRLMPKESMENEIFNFLNAPTSKQHPLEKKAVVDWTFNEKNTKGSIDYK